MNLPSRPAPGRLLGRETDVAMVLDRVTKAGEDIVVLAAPGLGASTVVAEVSNRRADATFSCLSPVGGVIAPRAADLTAGV